MCEELLPFTRSLETSFQALWTTLEQAAELTSCENINGFYQRVVFEELCDDVPEGLLNYWVSCCLLAVLLLVLVRSVLVLCGCSSLVLLLLAVGSGKLGSKRPAKLRKRRQEAICHMVQRRHRRQHADCRQVHFRRTQHIIVYAPDFECQCRLMPLQVVQWKYLIKSKSADKDAEVVEANDGGGLIGSPNSQPPVDPAGGLPARSY